ncbi:Swarming motility protein SwrB [Metabacillus sp. Hm71]|uniref:Swarming motility protein SwrB n=1 Tax=Metabacillus sp. Hm71 TaxID=3450743 RepID=UPI003F42958E
MTILLFIISLLLHIVSFYFIIVLFTKYSTIKDLANTQKKLLEETEEAMTGFLIEIKDENERLLSELKQQEKLTVSEERVEVSSKKLLEHGTEMDKTQKELPEYLNSVNKIEDIIELSHFSQEKSLPFEMEAINLYEKGYTLEQIAKKLNRGKTEIELLLKFRQN